MKKRSYKKLIRKSHRYLGVFIGIQVFFWTVSGVFFSWTSIDEIRGDHLRENRNVIKTLQGSLSPLDIKNKLLAKQKFELLSIEKAKEKETFIKNVIFGVSILLLVGLFIFYKNAKKLSKQKDEINNKNLDLKVTLKQNEVLLKEVHHRVKNNLTILSGLFYLQEKETKNKEDENFLKECQNRINSMAMVHQKLYQTGDMSKINFGLYCKELLSSLSNSFFSKEKEIVFKIDHDEVFLDIEKAIPLALIITELVTNSFKYAFINKVL